MIMVKAVMQSRDGQENEYFLREGRNKYVDEHYYWSRVQAAVFSNMRDAALIVNSEKYLFNETYGHMKAMAFIEVGK